MLPIEHWGGSAVGVKSPTPIIALKTNILYHTYADYVRNGNGKGRTGEKETAPGLFSVLLLQELSNCLQLNVTCAFVDGTDLAVTEHFLGDAFTDKAHAAHPFDGGAGHTARNLRGVQLGHGGVLDKVLTGFLLACGIVDESPCGSDFDVSLGQLVLHTLESSDKLTELATVIPDVAVIDVSDTLE